MAYPVSPAYLDMLAATEQNWAAEVEVWNGAQYLETLPNLTAGSVTVTETAATRRTCTVTLESQGRDLDSLIPVQATDLLHPASGNELRIFRGFRYASGITELVPLGVFRLSKPKVTDTDSGLAITVSGNDRSAWVARRQWTVPFVIEAGTNAATAIRSILIPRIPAGTPFNFAPTTVALPRTVLGANPATGQNNPMADAQNIAANLGMELFFDVLGIPTLRPVPTPRDLPVSWSYAEGASCTITGSIGRTFDETTTYNGVIAVGQAAGKAPTGATLAPVSAAVWTETPQSPIRRTGPWGEIPFFLVLTSVPATGQTQEGAQATVQAAAEAQFPLVVTALDTPTFSCVPNSAMQEGDALTLTRSRLGLDSTYVVAGLTIPLGPSAAETVILRPQSQAA